MANKPEVKAEVKPAEKPEVKIEVKPIEKPAKNFKKEYEVAVTGFYFKGKMFRGRQKIDSKIYHDYIELWLKEGKIR